MSEGNAIVVSNIINTYKGAHTLMTLGHLCLSLQSIFHIPNSNSSFNYVDSDFNYGSACLNDFLKNCYRITSGKSKHNVRMFWGIISEIADAWSHDDNTKILELIKEITDEGYVKQAIPIKNAKKIAFPNCLSVINGRDDNE